MKKNIKVTILIITILLIFSITSFAANTTNTTNQTGINSNNVNTTSTTSQGTKSSNANLSNLGITPNDFSGFKESKTEYNVSVPNNITEVEVYATKKDSKASVAGTGKLKLNEGENSAKITVTAEDGTTKTYTINIKRLKIGEKESTTKTKSDLDLALEKLEIKGVNLEPSFNKDIHQYTVNIEGEEKVLDIEVEANQSSAKVEVIGNEKLINGQNIITILVTDSNETSVATYQIYANKNLVTQEELNKQIEEAQLQYNIKIWIVRILIIIIVICIILLLIVIYKKTNSEKYKKEKRDKRINKAKIKKEKKQRKLNKKEKKDEKNGKHKRKH